MSITKLVVDYSEIASGRTLFSLRKKQILESRLLKMSVLRNTLFLNTLIGLSTVTRIDNCISFETIYFSR